MDAELLGSDIIHSVINPKARLSPFRKGMRDLGWNEGQKAARSFDTYLVLGDRAAGPLLPPGLPGILEVS
jgi:hypothetical protein